MRGSIRYRLTLAVVVAALFATACGGNAQLARLSAELDQTRTFSDEQKDCITAAAEQDQALLTALLGDARRHTLEQRTDVTIAQVDCTPDALIRAFAAGQSQIWGVRVPTDTHRCFVDSLAEGVPDRRDRVRGLTALNSGTEAPANSLDPLVDIYVDCLPSSVFLAGTAEGIASDPILGQAADPACLESAVTTPDLRPVYRQLIESGEQTFNLDGSDEFEAIFAAFFECVSVGTLLSTQAAQSGVGFDDTTIACIDEGTADLPVGAVASSDPAVDAELNRVLDECLSTGQRAAIPQGDDG